MRRRRSEKGKVQEGENTWEITARHGTANICSVIRRGAAEILKVNMRGLTGQRHSDVSFPPIIPFCFFVSYLLVLNTESVSLGRGGGNN